MEDDSFIKQSLTDTLKNGSIQRSSSNKSLTRPKRILNVKELTSRKTKADEDTGGILKALGLTPTPRRIANRATFDNDDGGDWEQVDNDRSCYDEFGSKGTSTPKATPLPTGPEEFLKNSSPTGHFNQGSGSGNARHSSLKADNETITSLRNKLSESEKAKEELLSKCRRLERELNEVKDSKTRPEGKTLAAREYEELEKQFDAQEKLLSGYQRENERSLIELESVKVKSLKMATFLNKVYGPDWEDTIGLNDPSPTSNINQNTSHTCTLTPLPTTPAEKFTTQLAQVQLLVQGMERRLVARQGELESLSQVAKKDSDELHQTISKIDLNQKITV
ncbi:uncharacterized protein MELLADRAFT_70707 [Melampsora larici-populina 98AG31]|uniref:Uncharacterized protein n=1 Tax=Melampsora larici-populina (strain 98AG31 / pathotype 3-4-7) TaxID=747676 RepID=F4R5S5_MELLP|nr:uncharacterized protein MELLADRAFT_70707 [Melampsora larici-populina 98AG31]EGG12204.1 hypothetical protein MELLADRAFT_70707 [Melampsora larici-populina 98AG31]